jgi:large subunit ribosomal protein L21
MAPGATVEISEVYLLAIENEITVGHPTVANARVVAEVIGEGRDEKVVIFKKKRRKGYKRTLGHRQHFTSLRIREIVLGDNIYKAAAGASRSDAPKAKKAAPARPLPTERKPAEPPEMKPVRTPEAPSPKAVPSIEPGSRAQADRGSVVDPKVPGLEPVGTPSTTPEPISAAPPPVVSWAPPSETPPAPPVETTPSATPARPADLPRAQTPPLPQPVEAPAFRKHWYWLAAVILALVIGAGWLLLSNLRPRATDVAPVPAQPEAAPSAPKPAVKEVTIKKPAAGAVPSAPVQPPD